MPDGDISDGESLEIDYRLNLTFVDLILLLVWWKDFERNFIFGSQMRFASWSTKGTIRTKETNKNICLDERWYIFERPLRSEGLGLGSLWELYRRAGVIFLLEIINMFPRWIIFSISIWVSSKTFSLLFRHDSDVDYQSEIKLWVNWVGFVRMFDEEKLTRKYYSANTELDNSREAIIWFFCWKFEGKYLSVIAY